MRYSKYIDLFEKNAFEIIKTWLTNDARPGRENERWVNILARKLT